MITGPDSTTNDDGVQRDKLDYRAGYVEGLAKALRGIQVNGMRAKKSEVAGLEIARQLVLNLREAMIEKMRAK